MKLASIGLAAFALLMASPALADPVKNIVLVHGAWADGSGWQGVYAILKKDGYNVSVVSNPLTSLADDVAATDRVVDRQDGPVILVGHSYGGAVITEAGDNPKVAGLVYVAAFAPDKGESVLGLLPKDGPQPPIEVTKDGFIFFSNGAYQAAFAAGVPPAQADFMQASQVPQWPLAGASSGSGRSVSISPRKNKEPASRASRFVCLPIQPRPAFRASAFSSTGAESTHTR